MGAAASSTRQMERSRPRDDQSECHAPKTKRFLNSIGGNSVAKVGASAFGPLVRKRRRQLDWTQDELALRLSISTSYIGRLESGQRCPSDEILTRMAYALGLDFRELYLLAKPEKRALVEQHNGSNGASAWESFRKAKRLQHVHHITREEMKLLSQVALLGDVRTEREFMYILNAVRQALGR